MKIAGVRQFRKDVPKLVKGGHLVLVTWHGRPQSFLMPFKDIRKMPRELRMEFLEQTGGELRDHFRKLGATEEKILADFETWRKARRARRRGR